MLSHQPIRKYWTACSAVLTCGALLLPASVGASSAMDKKAAKETTININQHVVVVSGRMSLGAINGESGEYVYVPRLNHKLSQLDWTIEDVYMLGLGGSISPLSWLKLNADIWFKLNDGDGTMDDYDWYLVNFQYTDWSHHENVDLTKGIMFDVNAELTFYRWEGSNFFGIAGFKHDNWEWEARGGDFVYSTNFLYDTVGSFPDDELGITYEQKFYAPYIGIGFSATLNPTPITFSGRFIGSPVVFGEDKDQHHMRDLVFEEDFDSGTMFAIDLSGAYNFTKNFSVMLSYHYQKFDEMNGETTVTDTTTGEVTKFDGDVAGMDHSSDMISVSAIVNF